MENPNCQYLPEEGKTLSKTYDRHLKIHNLNLWMNCEKSCPNLTFIVENKMENLQGHILNIIRELDI